MVESETPQEDELIKIKKGNEYLFKQILEKISSVESARMLETYLKQSLVKLDSLRN